MRFLVFFITLLYGSCIINYSNSLDPKKRLSVEEFLSIVVVNECGINYVYSEDEVKKALKTKMPYVKFKNRKLDDVLDFLLVKRLNLFYSLKKDLEINYLKKEDFDFNFLVNKNRGSIAVDVGDNVISNDYEFFLWDRIKKDIIQILKNYSKDYKEPIINKDAGIISVIGSKKALDAVREYIKKVKEALLKEVFIDVKIYSIELSKSHSKGVNWKALGFVSSYSGPVENYSIVDSTILNSNAFLNFLASWGNVNSISNPKIVTMNNQKALVSIGETVYYKYLSKTIPDRNGNILSSYSIGSQFVGIILDITPKIDKDYIILNISPKISAFRDISQLNDTNRGMPPDVRENKIVSTIRLKDGYSVLLGGLITSEDSFRVNGVPILKEIPLIKYLFSSKEKISNKKELIFIITPHIIKNIKKIN